MFRCQYSGEISEPKEKPVRLVVKTRNKTYCNMVRDDEDRRYVEKYTQGTEIVKEMNVRAKHVETAKKVLDLL